MIKFRKILFWSHLVAGVLAGVIILVMSLTGAILAFEPQIVAFSQRDARWVSVKRGTSPLNVSQLMENVQKQYPDKAPNSLIIYNDPRSSVGVSFGRDDKVYIDPYTGRFLEASSKVHDWMRVIESWHRWLGSREYGRPVTGACNLMFLFLALSGLYLWWPRSWSVKAFKSILFFKWKLPSRQRDWNWHNVIGFWCLPFFIIVTLTGAVMSYKWANDLLYKAADSEVPPPRRRSNNASSKQADSENRLTIDYDEVIAQIRQKDERFKSIRMRLPQDDAKKMDVTVEQHDRFYPAPRSTATIDIKTSELSKWKSYKEESRGRKWRIWARYLHTGQAGGVIGQLIGLVVCLGGCVLVWTGLALAWRRFFRKKK